MYVPVTMERREKINKFKKIPKVMAEPRCHPRPGINLRCNLSFKEVESDFSLSQQERKGIPTLYNGKGDFL